MRSVAIPPCTRGEIDDDYADPYAVEDDGGAEQQPSSVIRAGLIIIIDPFG